MEYTVKYDSNIYLSHLENDKIINEQPDFVVIKISIELCQSGLWYDVFHTSSATTASIFLALAWYGTFIIYNWSQSGLVALKLEDLQSDSLRANQIISLRCSGSSTVKLVETHWNKWLPVTSRHVESLIENIGRISTLLVVKTCMCFQRAVSMFLRNHGLLG